MIRMPPHLDNDWQPVKRTCPGFGRTTAQNACAVQVYRAPLHKRLLWAICRHGWAIVPIVLAVLVLTGCDDVAAARAIAADAAAAPNDAREQARREWLQQLAEARP